MDSMTTRILVFAFTVWTVLPLKAVLALEKPERLIVIGVENRSGSDEWDEHLVALGVTNLIAEAFFATGRYIPMETNPEIVKKLSELSRRNRQPATLRTNPSLLPVAPPMESDAVAYGIIRRYDKKRKRAIAGFFSFAKVTATLEIEVVVEKKNGDHRSAVGTGEGNTISKGVLVQIREEKIGFDQTCLGTVARAAVKDAINQLYPNK